MGHSTIDIERGLRISRERLREWTAKGFIAPSFPSPGQGRRAEFDDNDLLAICLFEEMLKNGLQRKTAGECVQIFRDKITDAAEFMVLLWKEGKVSGVILGGGDPVDIPGLQKKFLSQGYSQISLISIEPIRKRVKAAFHS